MKITTFIFVEKIRRFVATEFVKLSDKFVIYFDFQNLAIFIIGNNKLTNCTRLKKSSFISLSNKYISFFLSKKVWNKSNNCKLPNHWFEKVPNNPNKVCRMD